MANCKLTYHQSSLLTLLFSDQKSSMNFFLCGEWTRKNLLSWQCLLLLHPLPTQNCARETEMHWILIAFKGSGLHQSVIIPFPVLLKNQIVRKRAFDKERMCDVSSCEAVGTIYVSATSQTLKPVCVVLWTSQDLNRDELLLYSSQQPSKS